MRSRDNSALSRSADVVVIGGGIVGCATAYHLAKKGVGVVLAERAHIADAQSGRNWGFIRVQGRDRSEIPLMVASNRMWMSLSHELQADIEWIQGGSLALAEDERRMGRFEEWLKIARDFRLGSKLVTRREIADLVPRLAGNWIGGMHTATDGHVDPKKATFAFASAAERHGAQIRTLCSVTDVEVTNGRVSGVLIGERRIRTSVVVCAAGVGSRDVARMVGLSLPQLVAKGSVAETTPVPAVTHVAVWSPGLGFRQRRNGSFLVAPARRADHYVTGETFRFLKLFLPSYLENWRLFNIHVDFEAWKAKVERTLRRERWGNKYSPGTKEPGPNLKRLEQAHRAFAEAFPHLANVGFARTWAGEFDITPDGLPVLGEVAHPEGFLFATGFSGHGFALGPIVGALISEIIIRGKAALDIFPMRYSRFEAGDIAKSRAVI